MYICRYIYVYTYIYERLQKPIVEPHSPEGPIEPPAGPYPKVPQGGPIRPTAACEPYPTVPYP